jgi:hypothetical protein
VSGGALLRAEASSRSEVRGALARNLVVQVKALAGAYYRVVLPDGTGGFVASRDIRDADEPIERAAVSGTLPMRDRPLPHAAVIDTLRLDTGVDVLGRFGDFSLVRLPDSRTGWIFTPPDAQ